MALFSEYATRFAEDEVSHVAFSSHSIVQLARESHGLLAAHVPMRLVRKATDSLSDALQRADAELSALERRRTYARDTVVRRVPKPQQSALLLGLVVGESARIAPVTVQLSADGLRWKILYDAAHLDAADAERMLGHLRALGDAVAAAPTLPMCEMTLLNTTERTLVMHEWQGKRTVFAESITGIPDAANSTLHELIAHQAASTPDRQAVVIGDQSLTYAEMQQRALTVARALAAHGVGPNTLVGVCMERSIEMVVALVGILNAGAAYVPIDPEYPTERLAFMLQDSRCPIVLTQKRVRESVLEKLPTTLSTVLWSLDSDWDQVAKAAAAAPEIVPSTADDLAYMIYTSGSTGQPKGALNRHRGIVNRLLWMQNEYLLHERDVVLQKTPFSFDVSVWEFFWPLLSGAKLVLAKPGGHRDPEYLRTLIRDAGVTVCHFVPSMLRAFLDERTNTRTSLRDVMCSGEALPFDLQEAFFAEYPTTRLHNLYGPTEAAVDVTYWECQPGDPRKTVPIGRPVANTQMYVLDARLAPLPVGIPGELFIGGVQVGAGYHQRPDLTNDRFLSDPFDRAQTHKLYRTGDRARWLNDGTIEYLGRLDFQVKVRGFRIEIGEIEAAINAVPGVKESVVVLRSDVGIEPQLVAYYVTHAEHRVATSEVRSRLAERLPAHMVPGPIVELKVFPLSPSGKLDRRALPAPQQQERTTEIVAPRDDVERRLHRVWQNVLGVREVGVHDTFNDLGGHSLAALRVVRTIEKEFGTPLQLIAMLEHNTVAKLATLLRDAPNGSSWECIVPFSTGATGTPIFCPHAQTGYVLIYQHLAQQLGETNPVYGLQAVGNFGDQQPMDTMDEMLEMYTQEILKLYPTGPYIFFGVSLGGWLALELSRRMRALGHTVQLVSMYDSERPGYPLLTRYGRIVKYVKDRGGISFARLRKTVNVPLPRPWQPSSFRTSASTLYWNMRETLQWWRTHRQRRKLIQTFALENPPLDYVLPTDLTRVRLANRRVKASYQPAPYDGDLLYFSAEYQQYGAIPDVTNGWGELIPRMEIHLMPGGHTDGLRRPLVNELVKVLREAILRTNSVKEVAAPTARQAAG